ncbi:hypothetical protein D3C85_1438650 [compost metagenome]
MFGLLAAAAVADIPITAAATKANCGSHLRVRTIRHLSVCLLMAALGRPSVGSEYFRCHACRSMQDHGSDHIDYFRIVLFFNF